MEGLPAGPAAAIAAAVSRLGGRRRRVVVCALGGNALLERGQDQTMATQRANVSKAVDALLPVVTRPDIITVITHGNGPQIGRLAVQMPEDGLDVLGAESQGQIGWLLEVELRRKLGLRSSHAAGSGGTAEDSAGGGRDVATVITSCVIDGSDPSFKNPTKFIGPVYKDKEEAERAAADAAGSGSSSWTIKQDGDKGWRRVVPSPRPLGIQQLGSIRSLLAADTVVICGGGGGVPVAVQGSRSSGTSEPASAAATAAAVEAAVASAAAAAAAAAAALQAEPHRLAAAADDSRRRSEATPAFEAGSSTGTSGQTSQETMCGVDAVIDKDATSCLLAEQLGASTLLILTDVPAVYEPEAYKAGRRQPVPSPVRPGSLDPSSLPPGSMRPKVEAALRFAASGPGRMAVVGALGDVVGMLEGRAGTMFVGDSGEVMSAAAADLDV